jgi:hypothetical protein
MEPRRPDQSNQAASRQGTNASNLLSVISRNQQDAIAMHLASPHLPKVPTTPDEERRNIISWIQQLSDNPGKCDVQEKGIVMLCNFAVESEHRAFIRDRGGMKAVLDAMASHREHSELQLKACACLANLALEEYNIDILRRNGGIEAILSAMKSYKNVFLLQAFGCLALQTLATKEENKNFIVEHDGIKTIVLAIKNHAHNSMVQKHACGALMNLATVNTVNKETILRLKGVEALLHIVGEHCSDQEVVTFAFDTLSSLSIHARTKDIFAENNGVQRITAAMRSLADRCYIQQQGCKILWHSSAQHKKNAETIQQIGGADVVVSAMSKHRREVGVQENGCAVFATVGSLCESTEQEGCVVAVACAMITHKDSHRVQRNGCYALCHLKTGVDLQVQKSRTHSFKAIVLAMETHAYRKDIQYIACKTLLILGSQRGLSANSQACILALVRATERFLSDDKVLVVALRCLHKTLTILSTNEARVQAAESGGIGAVVKAMMTFKSDSKVLLHGCGILHALFEDKTCANHESVVALNVAEVVIDAWTSSADVQVHACGALSGLCHSKFAREAIVRRGGVDKILIALCNEALPCEDYCASAFKVLHFLLFSKSIDKLVLRKYLAIRCVVQAMQRACTDGSEQASAQATRIQTHGSALIYMLSDEDQDCEVISRHRGIQAIVQAMREHPNNQDVHKFCCGALERLSIDKPQLHSMIKESKALDALVQSLGVNLHYADIRQRACRALRNIATNPDMGEPVMSTKCVSIMITAMNTHREDEETLATCACTFASLVATHPGRVVVTELSGIQTVLSMMRLHKSCEQLHEHGMLMLMRISSMDVYVEKLRLFGWVEEAVYAMNTFKQNAALQEHALGLLRYMSASMSNHQGIKDCRAVQAVVASMDAHGDNVNIQDAGCRIFKNLMSNKKIKEMIKAAGGDKALERAIERFQDSNLRDTDWSPVLARLRN